MTNENIVEFPKSRIISDRVYDVDENSKYNMWMIARKKKFVDNIINNYTTQLIEKLSMQGFNTHDEKFIENFTYTSEALRATLYQSLDMEHPFKDHMEQIIEFLKNPSETD